MSRGAATERSERRHSRAHETLPDAGAANDSDALASGEDALSLLGRACPRVVAYACTESEHVLQLYAGLYLLHATGRIRLAQRRAAPLPVADLAGLLLDVEGRLVFLE